MPSQFAGLPDFFAPGVLPAFVLVALRVGGLLLVAPAWSSKQVPMKLRTALLVLFAMLLLPAALDGLRASGSTTPVQVTPATFLAESAIGLAFGLAASMVLAGAEFAGELMTTTIGLSGAAIFDPVNNTQGALFASFMQLLALLFLLLGSGHLVMLQALGKSFTTFPLGAPIALNDGLRALVMSAGSIFATGLQFAAPVIAAVLLANLALAILGRAAPQLQIMSLAFPLQIGLGLMVFAGSLGLLGRALNDWTPAYRRHLDAFARAAVSAQAPAGRR